MKIAIIGAGGVGAALTWGWTAAGHQIVLGLRNPGDEKYAALIAMAGVSAASPAEAAAEGDVIVLATPWGATEGAVAALGDLGGKTLIDCTNPLGMVEGALNLTVGFDASGGEMVAGWAKTARVVKALNQIGAEGMESARAFPHPPAMFMAGEDDAAKAEVAGLLSDLGFDPLDAGGIDKARLLEPLAMVWINQALFRGKGRDWGFAALPRG